MSDNVLLALPCHAQVSAEALKRDGVAACLLKPLTTTRLLPALVATSHALASAPLMQIDSHKLPMTVMAVDDNPANLKLIGALLDDLVQQVILCDSGQQAVDKAKQLQMDLILMDIQMPDMDGIRACELIHHLSHHQQTPVIAVTAHATEGQRESTERRHERLSGEANRRRETARTAAALSARPAQRRSGVATARRADRRS